MEAGTIEGWHDVVACHLYDEMGTSDLLDKRLIWEALGELLGYMERREQKRLGGLKATG